MDLGGVDLGEKHDQLATVAGAGIVKGHSLLTVPHQQESLATSHHQLAHALLPVLATDMQSTLHHSVATLGLDPLQDHVLSQLAIPHSATHVQSTILMLVHLLNYPPILFHQLLHSFNVAYLYPFEILLILLTLFNTQPLYS